MLRKSSVFLLFAILLIIQCNDNEDANDDFVPTKEWQPVRKGQKIPKGLHVRMNLETGVTEAKLLDENDETTPDKRTALSAPAVPRDETTPESDIPKPTLAESLKNIKSDELFTPDDLKGIKDKFRSYDEIKKSLGELNLSPKIDAEIITDLLKRHKESENREEILKILEDLDYLAHQYDNAREFVRQDGFKEVIYKNLNSTDADLRKETLKLLGALMQNNVNPKIHALETGAVATILRIINSDPDARVKDRALSALGALLRSFPAAQKKFVETGGLSVLSQFFDSDNIKIQIKLVTMISDLIVEHMFSSTDEKLSPYYATFDLTEKILEHDWCKKLNKLLLGLLITDKDDHDSVEKCLAAMHSLRGNCGDQFETGLLLSLKSRYHTLGAESGESDGDGAFFRVLEDFCEQILHFAHTVKTEL